MRSLTVMGLVLSLTILITPDTFPQGRGGQRGMRGGSSGRSQMQMNQRWQMQNRYGIKDLKDSLATVQSTDVRRVYQNLLRASENPLRAFSANQ